MKRVAIAMLVCLNAALAAGIVLLTWSPNAAWAQGTGLAGNYVVVAGEIRDEFDALYLIDLRTRMLHGMMFDRTTKRVEYVDSRDLERDFRNNQENP